nr:MAG TPA: hypothetical protein [Caudoviricetes sp.]
MARFPQCLIRRIFLLWLWLVNYHYLPALLIKSYTFPFYSFFIYNIII